MRRRAISAPRLARSRNRDEIATPALTLPRFWAMLFGPGSDGPAICPREGCWRMRFGRKYAKHLTPPGPTALVATARRGGDLTKPGAAIRAARVVRQQGGRTEPRTRSSGASGNRRLWHGVCFKFQQRWFPGRTTTHGSLMVN